MNQNIKIHILNLNGNRDRERKKTALSSSGVGSTEFERNLLHIRGIKRFIRKKSKHQTSNNSRSVCVCFVYASFFLSRSILHFFFMNRIFYKTNYNFIPPTSKSGHLFYTCLSQTDYVQISHMQTCTMLFSRSHFIWFMNGTASIAKWSADLLELKSMHWLDARPKTKIKWFNIAEPCLRLSLCVDINGFYSFRIM